MHPHRRDVLIGLLGSALLPGSAYAQTVTGGRGEPIRPVIELFTSQGCSSCPAADAVLETYAGRQDVVALSFSVDYWDHLGWKDTLASPRYTSRQKAYAKSLSTGNVYTPQVVVDGTIQTVGSNQAAIEQAIQRSRQAAGGARIAIVGKAEGDKLTVDIAGAPSGDDRRSGTIWMAMVDARVDVEIKHGENRGRKLSYYNVVRDISPVGMWYGKAVTLALPHAAEVRAGQKCAVFLQAGDAGHILGATWVATV